MSLVDECKEITHTYTEALFAGKTVKHEMTFNPMFNPMLFTVGSDGLQVNQLVYSLSSAEFALSALLCF